MSNNKETGIRYEALDRCFRNTSRRFFIEDVRKACSAALYRETGTDKYSDPDNPCISKKHIYDDIQFLICSPKYYAPIVKSEADAAFNRIVDTVMHRMRRCDDTLYREYNQNEGLKGNSRNLLRQIIDDQDYREVVDNQSSES